MKSIILAILLFLFLGFVSTVAAQEPPKIIVNTVVVNDGAGELAVTDLGYDIDLGNGFGYSYHGQDLPKTYILKDGSLPTSFRVSSPDGGRYGDWQSRASLYAVYTASLSGDCSGTIDYGETKPCTITFNDGDVKYGWGYTETDPGLYSEKMQPLTTSCTYRNRAQIGGNELVKAPVPSPDDNISGCPAMKTKAELKAEADAAAKEAERQALIAEAKKQILEEIARSTPAHAPAPEPSPKQPAPQPVPVVISPTVPANPAPVEPAPQPVASGTASQPSPVPVPMPQASRSAENKEAKPQPEKDKPAEVKGVSTTPAVPVQKQSVFKRIIDFFKNLFK